MHTNGVFVCAKHNNWLAKNNCRKNFIIMILAHNNCIYCTYELVIRMHVTLNLPCCVPMSQSYLALTAIADRYLSSDYAILLEPPRCSIM